MMRMFSSLLLALMLALTSQSMAVARGASAATGQMVLCTGSGPVAVYFDAEGEPTSAPHICPDSALNVLYEFERLDLHAPAHAVACAPACEMLVPIVLVARFYGPPSRGPPVFV
jgi:hypothetical protein